MFMSMRTDLENKIRYKYLPEAYGSGADLVLSVIGLSSVIRDNLLLAQWAMTFLTVNPLLYYLSTSLK